MVKKFIRTELWVNSREASALRRIATGYGVSVAAYLHMVVFDPSIPRPVVKTANQNGPRLAAKARHG